MTVHDPCKRDTKFDTTVSLAVKNSECYILQRKGPVVQLLEFIATVTMCQTDQKHCCIKVKEMTTTKLDYYKYYISGLPGLEPTTFCIPCQAIEPLDHDISILLSIHVDL